MIMLLYSLLCTCMQSFCIAEQKAFDTWMVGRKPKNFDHEALYEDWSKNVRGSCKGADGDHAFMYSRWLVPVLKSNHWSLLDFRFGECTMFIYDSFGIRGRFE